MEFGFDAFATFVVVLMAVVGLVALAAAKRRHDALRTQGVRVPGIIVRNKVCWGRVTVVRPVVRFVTRDGQTVETIEENGFATAIPRYPEGASVTILYNPADPHDFDIVAADRQYM